MLTDRDAAILDMIYRHRYVTTGQIQRRFFSGRRTCQTRLQQLHSAGLLGRYRPVTQGEGRRDFIHWITDAGCKEIGQPPSKRPALNPAHMRHYLAVTDYVLAKRPASYDLAPDIGGYNPDAYIETTILDRTRTAYVEVDMGTESEAKIERKVRAYERAYKSGREAWPYIVFVAPSAGRLQTLKAWVEKHRKVREMIYQYETMGG